MFCRQCGNELSPEALFCRRCGAAIRSVASAAAASRTAVPVPPITAGPPPASRTSSAPAENPTAVSVHEIPRPIPVASPGRAKIEPEQKEPDRMIAPRKATHPPLMWVGVGLVVLVAAVTVILYLRSGHQATVPDAEIGR